MPQCIKQLFKKRVTLTSYSESVSAVIERNIGYKFRNTQLLNQIFIHSSLPESKNFQKLKFLGEKILHAVVADNVYGNPNVGKNNVTGMQNLFISEIAPKNLAQKFQEMGVAAFVQFNKSNDSMTVYSDTLKALIGGIYQDNFNNTEDKTQSVIRQLVLKSYYKYESAPLRNQDLYPIEKKDKNSSICQSCIVFCVAGTAITVATCIPFLLQLLNHQ